MKKRTNKFFFCFIQSFSCYFGMCLYVCMCVWFSFYSFIWFYSISMLFLSLFDFGVDVNLTIWLWNLLSLWFVFNFGVPYVGLGLVWCCCCCCCFFVCSCWMVFSFFHFAFSSPLHRFSLLLSYTVSTHTERESVYREIVCGCVWATTKRDSIPQSNVEGR